MEHNPGKGFSSKLQSLPASHHYSHHHHHYHSNQNESKLYSMNSIELKDQIENSLEESYIKLQHLINPSQSQPDNIIFNELSQYASQSKAHYDEISNGLLYSILTDPSNSARCLRNLFLCNNLSFNISNDSIQNTPTSSSSYVLLITNLTNIIVENYFRLLDTPRQQLIWLLKELTKARVNQFDKLLLNMLRNIQSGLLSDKNIWLAESMLEIIHDQTPASATNLDHPATLWLYSHNELMTQAVYTYLRLLSDHSQSSTLISLRQRETEFCIQVLREKWNECVLIGRDLVRLLQNLAKINEFNLLWKDIITSPQNLSQQFAQLGGLAYLLRLPTRKRCLISRLTVEMERKVYFIITSVKAGQQKRYLEWFQRQYLNTPESQSLRIDIIRYICVVVHPTNEQLNAGLTPRWSLCAWLLNTCTSLIDSANLKLALFFDWIFYDAKKDNIMLIEPGILLMYYSLRPNNLILNNANNINLTVTLFDFLCRVINNFHLPLKDFILIGIMQSFKDSVDKRVIPSLQIFFNSVNQPIDASSGTAKDKFQGQPVLDKDIRSLIQFTFGNFFQSLVIPPFPNNATSNVNQQQQQLIKPISTTLPQENIAQSSPISSTASLNNFGSNQSSLFKNKQTEDITTSVTPSSSLTLFSANNEIAKNEYIGEMKSEPVNFIGNDSSSKQDSAFSDDEESNSSSNINTIKPEETDFNNEDTNDTELLFQNNVLTSNTNLANPSPSASILLLEQQLQQFTTKPFKLFTIIDETASNIKPNNLILSLDTHLNLIPSDDLRNKLADLNEKLTVTNSINSNNRSKISYIVKDLLNFMCRDSEFLNNFGSSLTDLAVSICLIFKNDFTNVLLPLLFYSSTSSSASSGQNDIDLFSMNTFRANTNYLSLINESINQRPIFLLFKELSLTANQSHEREILLQLLNEIYLKQNRIGYFFLYYIYYVGLNSMVSSPNSQLIFNSSASLQTPEVTSLIRIYKEFIKERHNQQSSSFNNNLKSNSDNEIDEANKIKSKNVNYEPITSSSSNNSSTQSSNSSSESSVNSENESNEDKLTELTEDDLIIGNYLMQDIRLCQQDDSMLFIFLLPFLLNNNNLIPSSYLINNSELIYLIVSCIDAKQLKDLIVNVTSHDVILLKHSSSDDQSPLNKNKKDRNNSSKENLQNINSKKRKRKNSSKLIKSSYRKINLENGKKGCITYKKENLGQVLKASLYWETIEQIFFWEILLAHDDIDLNFLLPVFNNLDPNRNSEAIGYLFKLIKESEPTYDIVTSILKRNPDDKMTRALFINWVKNFSSAPTKLAQIFVKILNKSAASIQKQSSTKKIKINESSFSLSSKKLTVEQQLESLNSNNKENRLSLNDLFNNLDKHDSIPSLIQVLSHLNNLRQDNNCISFILKDSLLETLKKIYNKYLDEETRKKYTDLFSLGDDFIGSEEENYKNDQNEEDENKTNDEDQNEEIDENKRKRSSDNKSSNKRNININKRKKQISSTKQNNLKNSKRNTKQVKRQSSKKNSDSDKDSKPMRKDDESYSDSELDDSDDVSSNSVESSSSNDCNYSSSDEYGKSSKQGSKKPKNSNKNTKNKNKYISQQPPNKKLKKQNNENASD